MLGSPGAGKSMLARRLTTILPAMTLAEALETTRIHRVAGRTAGRTALGTLPSAAGACHAADILRAMPHAITRARPSSIRLH
jgi:predicted ATPase with chaperone activity